MNKPMKVILSLVMAAALAVVLLSVLDYTSLGNRLKDLETQLLQATSDKEALVAEKEPLYKDLQDKRTELNRVTLSLAELTERQEELKTENEQLQKDIDTLKSSGILVP